jgi:5S rRNA maturation endonuclease (ribonuclease M5)
MTAEEYLTKHSLSPAFVKEKLGWNWTEKSIAIPIYNQSGALLYNRIRHLDFEELKAMGSPDAKKFTYDPPKGNHPALYCLHKVAKAEQVIVCEGEPDCAVLWQNGIAAVTSTGGVTKFDDAMAQALVGKEVFLCLDTDKAGQDRIMKIARQLTTAGCTTHIVILPEATKDVAEFFATTPDAKAEFLKLVAAAITPGEYWSLHKPEDFATVTVSELMKMEFPPNPWLIQHILPKQGFVFFFAAEATYKTFTLLDISLCLAAGRNWLGQDNFKTERPAKVLIIDKENPMEMIQRRIKGLGYTEEVGNMIRWVKYPEKLQLVGENGQPSDFMQSLADEVVDQNIEFVVVDSFVDLMVGNENDAGDTQSFFNVLHEMFPTICVGALHHENKPAAGQIRSDSQRNRGSSNLNAQCSVMFRMELVAKSRTEFNIKQTKCRDDQKLNKFLVEAKIETAPDGKTTVAGFEYRGEVKDANDKVAEAEELIEELFNANPTPTKKDIVDTLEAKGIPLRTAERAIRNLKEANKIDAIKNGKITSYIWTGNSTENDDEN